MEKVVGLAVPPTAALGMAFVQNLEQIKKSWYMFFFQHGLADLVVGANNHAFIEMLWREWSPGYDASIDLEFVRKSLADPKTCRQHLAITERLLVTAIATLHLKHCKIKWALACQLSHCYICMVQIADASGSMSLSQQKL